MGKKLSVSTVAISYVVWIVLMTIAWRFVQKSALSRLQNHLSSTVAKQRPASRMYLVVYGLYLIAEAYYHTFVMGLLIISFTLMANIGAAIKTGTSPTWYMNSLVLLEVMTPQHALDHAVAFLALASVSTTWVMLGISGEDLRSEQAVRARVGRIRAFLPVCSAAIYATLLVRDYSAVSGG